MKILLTTLFLSLTLSTLAQVQFQFDQSIKVTENGNELQRAFEGGLNSAQFQTMDLNGDAISDLVIFHHISRSLSTYLNIDNQWVLSPKYQIQFPEDVVNWMILQDFDCDGKKDLFTSTALGIKVYRNISNGNGLSWEMASEFLTWDSGSNIQVAATDIPGIVDINGDGALDILTYRFGSAGSVDYYQNTGTCGNLTFTRITRQWGEFFDCGCNDFSFGQPCPTVGGFANLNEEPSEQQGTLHAGGKTILPFDADNDGDIDIITTDELCENLVFLRNEGDAENALMTSFSSYPITNPVSYQFFPSAFLEDIDFDGLKDLIVSTNLDKNVGDLVNFQSHIKAFSNLGSNNIPSFSNSSPFFQNEMIDVGEDAFPAFFDFDEDGDLDLFVSNTGNLINGEFVGTVWLYENTGNQFEPEFSLLTKDFAGLSALGYKRLKAQLSDLDNDGLTDLILHANVGPLDARVFFLKGDENLEFDGPVDLGFEANDSSNPYVFDLNEDGQMDVLIGHQFGSLSAYFNNGNLSFSEEQTNFGGLEDDFSKQNLSVAVGQFLQNTQPQIITIDSQGKLTLYDDQADENFRAIGSNQNLILFDDELTKVDFGRASYLATVDLHSDGVASLVIGSSKGGLYFLRNSPADGSPSENQLRVAISPNPSSSLVRLLTNSDGTAEIIDLSGRVIENNINIQRSVVRELFFDNVPSGMYLIRVRANDGRSVTKKVLIQP